MQYGLLSGLLWGLDTVILGIGMAMAPYFGSAEALAFSSIVGSFLHDTFCAVWLFGYMGVKSRLGDTLAALKTRSGKFVIVSGLADGGDVGLVLGIAQDAVDHGNDLIHLVLLQIQIIRIVKKNKKITLLMNMILDLFL